MRHHRAMHHLLWGVGFFFQVLGIFAKNRTLCVLWCFTAKGLGIPTAKNQSTNQSTSQPTNQSSRTTSRIIHSLTQGCALRVALQARPPGIFCSESPTKGHIQYPSCWLPSFSSRLSASASPIRAPGSSMSPSSSIGDRLRLSLSNLGTFVPGHCQWAVECAVNGAPRLGQATGTSGRISSSKRAPATLKLPVSAGRSLIEGPAAAPAASHLSAWSHGSMQLGRTVTVCTTVAIATLCQWPPTRPSESRRSLTLAES
jgi:hypothetical protein